MTSDQANMMKVLRAMRVLYSFNLPERVVYALEHMAVEEPVAFLHYFGGSPHILNGVILSDDEIKEITNLLGYDKFVQAITIARQYTSGITPCPLKEAKDFVEALRDMRR